MCSGACLARMLQGARAAWAHGACHRVQGGEVHGKGISARSSRQCSVLRRAGGIAAAATTDDPVHLRRRRDRQLGLVKGSS